MSNNRGRIMDTSASSHLLAVAQLLRCCHTVARSSNHNGCHGRDSEAAQSMHLRLPQEELDKD